MNLTLRAIDDTNLDAVLALEVSPQQAQYIASNKKSLDTAKTEEYREIARPFAIYADETPVGFTMFAFDLTSADPNDRYWLWRLMIGRDFQGRGYGAAALEIILDYFKRHGADHILLSTKETNTAALALSHKYRFAETGELNENETVLRLQL